MIQLIVNKTHIKVAALVLGLFTFTGLSHADDKMGKSPASDESSVKQILYVGDNHLATAKINILKESAKKSNLNLEVFSTRIFKKNGYLV